MPPWSGFGMPWALPAAPDHHQREASAALIDATPRALTERPGDQTAAKPAVAASLARLSPHSHLHRHSAIRVSTPLGPISRPGCMGQHSDRPPAQPACVVFFLHPAHPCVGTDLSSVQLWRQDWCFAQAHHSLPRGPKPSHKLPSRTAPTAAPTWPMAMKAVVMS